MTITAEQLQGAIDRACLLKNVRDAQILEDMQRNIKKWGSLTTRQENYANSLMERNSEEMVAMRKQETTEHADKWNKDEDYRNWVLFLAKFFISSQQNAYQIHIRNRKSYAANVYTAHMSGEVPHPRDCEMLTSSKLAPRLRDTYDHPPIYSVGDLVQRRKTELTWYENKEGLADEMGFITEVRELVSSVFAYNKTRGGTRVYEIMFPSGKTMLQERKIKFVSRKKRGE